MKQPGGHKEPVEDTPTTTSTTDSRAGSGVTDLRNALVQLVSDISGISPEQLDDARPLAEYGLTSRDAVGLAGELEKMLDRSLPATLLWEHPTIGQLVSTLTTADNADNADSAESDEQLDTSDEAAATSSTDDRAIAIVGIGCRLPGNVHGPDAFWEQLLAGTDAVSQVPEGRWRNFTGTAPDVTALMESTTQCGAFLDDIEGFDADFFGITPLEAEVMDPQQRLLLEVSCEALDHAGVPAHALQGTRTGVFVGLSALEYGHLTTSDPARLTPWTSTGAAGSIVANRVSYLLDLRGPSITTDSACSSSLVAVHLACRSLRSGECDTALAAGVNVLLSPAVTASFEQAGALAADGKCKPFDAAADGITRGEGCGVVVLKRLADAQRDGDRVIAVVRGTAVNQDGRSAGLMAPNPTAQEALLRDALRDARIDAADVDYVEAHGTGTLLGDPIEAAALGAVVGRGRRPDQPLLIGSVKSNLGHLEGAAGIIGLIKTALALQRSRIPASLHFRSPNPHIDFAELGLRVVTEPTVWPTPGHRPGRAGVSAFGFGGTNAHAVLEQAPPTVPSPALPSPADDEEGNHPHILVVSARSPDRLADVAASLSRWVAADDAPALIDIAHTLASHRRGPSCAAVVARTHPEAAARLAALARDETVPGVVAACTDAGAAQSSTARRPVFVFSGYGSQWKGMGRRLLTEDSVFAAQVSALDPVFIAESGSSLTDMLTSESGRTVDRTQPLLFGIQLALAQTMRAYGVEPAAVIGHSMGEVTAAVVAGALDAGDGLRVIACRSARLATIDAEQAGAMAAIELPAQSRTDILSRFPGVEVAVHSSPQRCTVAGPAQAVRDLVDELTEQGRLARLLEVGGAGHSAAVDPILPPLREDLVALRPSAPTTPWYSTVLDDPRADPAADASYWCANVRRPVRLQQAVTAATEDGHTLFLEISPHPIAVVPLTETLDATPGGDQALAVPTLHKNADDTVAVRAALARLHFAGVTMSTGLWPAGARTALPTPAWRHKRFWFSRHVGSTPVGGHPLLGVRTDDPRTGAVLWLGDVGTRRHRPGSTVHDRAVLTLAEAAELMIEAGLDLWAREGITHLGIEDLRIHQWLAISSSTPLTAVWEPASGTHGTVTLHARGTGTAWRCYASARITREPEPPGEHHPDVEQAPAFIQHFASADLQHPHRPSYAHLLTAMFESLSAAGAESTPPGSDRAVQATAHTVPVGVRTLHIKGPGILDTGYDIRCTPAVGADSADTDADQWHVTAQGATSEIVARSVLLRPIEQREVPRPLETCTYDIQWKKSTVPLPLGLHRALLVSDEPHAAGGITASLASALEAGGVGVTLTDAQDDACDSVLDAWLQIPQDGPSAVVLLFPQHERDDDMRPLRTAARVARCLAGGTHQQPPRLWMATVLAQATGPGEPGTPHLACLRGLVRVMALEHPHLRTSLVDIDKQPGAVGDLVQELLAGGDADEIAWRAGTRLTACLARADLTPQRNDEVAFTRPDGAYIITGGLTGLGLATAGRLAEQGVGRIVLNGRRAPGPEAQSVLAELLAQGISVAVVQGDIAEPDVAPSLVRAALAEGHTLRGIAHCAGVLHDRMITDLEPADLDTVLRPKTVGARNLQAATADHDLDWWVIYSSAAALVGSPGQSAYAAANAWLDAMAHHRRASGRPTTAIAWGPWENVGGAAGNPALALDPIHLTEGMDALQALVTLNRTHVGVVHLDTDRVLAAFPGLSAIPFFTDVLEDGALSADDWVGPAGIAALGSSAPDTVYARLVKRAAAIMGFSAHELNETTALTDLGLDSLMAVRIHNAVRQDFGIDLPASSLLRGACLRELGGAVLEQLGLGSAAPEAGSPPAAPDSTRQAQPSAPSLPSSLGARDAAERLVASAWAEVLHRGPTDIHEDFTAAGGDQRAAEAMAVVIRRRLGNDTRLSLTAPAILAHRTVAAVAELIRPVVNRTGQSALTTLRPASAGSQRPPLFTFHPAGGPTSVYLPLTGLLPAEQPVYGLERVEELRTMEDKAAHYRALMRDVQPEGPYHLLGWSFGGCLAYEVACQMKQEGQDIGFLGLIDTILPAALPQRESPEFLLERFGRFAEYIEKTYGHRLDLPYEELAATPDEQQIDVIMRLVADAGLDMSPGIMEHQRTSYVDARVGERYVPRPHDGHVVLYRAQQPQQLTTALDPRYLRQDADLGWAPLCESLEIVPVEGDHLSVIDPPHVRTIARHVARAIGRHTQ
ncbi:type I polyketide synthase [Streptomyces sp. NL15-2K]|uniref:type I polyketide synthase n=1 Tax=Streptomyces sp. NL15-2K TaxID=376149 RepID=UPI000F58AA51|nr:MULTISPECIES: type I polyketide synthase [Actinomycetes]WKX09226.1 type I polyketide synthase [Kutzneria buriramensis]GCB49291.1 malonyl CoA-acyl carrier protein transacylase [Streptomyces sp. NL15-2K]